jgi:hypothetical protein
VHGTPPLVELELVLEVLEVLELDELVAAPPVEPVLLDVERPSPPPDELSIGVGPQAELVRVMVRSGSVHRNRVIMVSGMDALCG